MPYLYVPEQDLAEHYELLLKKHNARAASLNPPSVTSASGDSEDERSEWRAGVEQALSRVMPESRAVLGYLAEHDHRESNPIGFYPLQGAVGITKLGGAIKSIHHWTAEAGLPDYALLRARTLNGKTVYWVEEDVAQVIRAR